MMNNEMKGITMLDKIIKIAVLAVLVSASVVLIKAAILSDIIAAHIKG